MRLWTKFNTITQLRIKIKSVLHIVTFLAIIRLMDEERWVCVEKNENIELN